MMRQSMSRKAATSGGFVTSVAIHAAFALFLVLVLRMNVDKVDAVMDELTEIAYIEERYGEDVAKQVRMKTKPIVAEPEPAKQVEEVAAAEPKVEEAKPAEVKPPEPALKSKKKLTSLKPPTLASRPTLKNKPMDIDAPRLSQAQQKQFRDVTNKSLDSKAFADVNMPKLDTSNLRNAGALAADVSAPSLQSKGGKTQAFDGKNMALVGRKSKTDLTDVDFDVSSSGSSSGGRMAMKLATGGVEGGNAALVGGRLEEGQTAWQGSVDELAQVAKANERRRPAEVDVSEPALQSRASDKGRRTMLDYGAGNDGARGSLKGGKRPALAEAPAAASIAAASEAKPQEKAQTLAEALPKGGKGVAMTISGQIQGRKIVQSSLPVYSDEAKKKGWEGMVAVHFTVMPDGRVKDNLYFEQTSPHRDLNRAAMDAIRQFVFESLQGAQRVEQWGVITIVFRLS
jgi:TonB family protein